MKHQYLTILLDDSAISFCSYQSNVTSRLIDIADLKKGVSYAKQNGLHLQLVYPNYDLPSDYLDVVSAVEHIAIHSYESASSNADIVVLTRDADVNPLVREDAVYIVNINKVQLDSLFNIVEKIYKQTQRINIVLNDIENFSEPEFRIYQQELEKIRRLVFITDEGVLNCQINVLTDILLLEKMNNCSAGQESITLAPNGKLYICPAFYYLNESYACGNLKNYEIKNAQLLDLDHAPICSICDTFHCKRCLYKNLVQTLEINTPSYEQCYISHIEREQSRLLGLSLPKDGRFKHIGEIDYMDPFEKIKH